MKGYTQGFIVRDPVVSDQYYELYSYIEARGANMGECWNNVRADRARNERELFTWFEWENEWNSRRFCGSNEQFVRPGLATKFYGF